MAHIITAAIDTETWIAWIDGRRDDAVEFEVPVEGDVDIADAGASALGVDLCEEINVSRK